MQRSLDTIRQDIDALDTQLTELLCRRMACAEEVAAYKAAHGLPVLNTARENEVLAQVRAQCDAFAAQRHGTESYADAAELVFATMMDTSRALQHTRLGSRQPLRTAIERACACRDMPTGRVVCQGRRGAYSDEAAAQLFPGCEPHFVTTFSDVFAALEADEADVGILPVENSSTGSVHEVYDLLMAYRFTIAAAVELPVRHCLLALPEADPAALRTVYSHPQGLSQCAEAIQARGLLAQPYSNTAAAAELVARKGDPHACAIASRRAAELYGLKVVAENIQSVSGNTTRFLALRKTLTISADANRISLLFSLPHVTGSLYRTLARFAALGLNLTKLESRPMRTGEFEYVFYLDFEGSVAQEGTRALLCALSEEMPHFAFLGNYLEQAGV